MRIQVILDTNDPEDLDKFKKEFGQQMTRAFGKSLDHWRILREDEPNNKPTTPLLDEINNS